MKELIIIISVASLSLLLSCNDTSIEDLDVTRGKVAGKDWLFDSGRGVETFNGLEITLMSDVIKYKNPCAILTPATPYVKIFVPAKRGTFNISSVAGSDMALVRFYEGSSSGKNLTAVSGYVNIISINGLSIDGIIDVSLNDDNILSYGAFFVETCN